MKSLRNKNKQGGFLGFLLLVPFIFLLALFLARPASAAGAGQPTAADNLVVYQLGSSYLVSTDSGYCRVFHDGTKVCVEDYDAAFQLTAKRSFAMELAYWGGFYAGSDAYYLVEGQSNTEESYAKEVIRVIKYSKSWKKLGTARITGNESIFGGEVRYPFQDGCVNMTELNGELYIATGHQGYVDERYGMGHQGLLVIAVDTKTMQGEIVKSDFSHSFAQYIETDGQYLYLLEQSEGGRYTSLERIDPSTFSSEYIPVLRYGGTRTSAWAIPCYASVDDLALSADSILGIGTSIDQSDYENVSSDTPHNIYLTITPKSGFTEEQTKVKWLTNFTGGGASFRGVKLTKIHDDRFLISWEMYEGDQPAADCNDSLSGYKLHYLFVDGNGNTLTKEFTAAAPISDCHPIVRGGKVAYCASSANMVNFYTIDGSSGSFAKKNYRVAGESATWKIDGEVLTISGSGAVGIDGEVHHRYAVSATGGASYYSSDNSWKPVRDQVKKIVIAEGITSIPESSFQYFANLAEGEVAGTVTAIGKQAFAFNRSLRKLTIRGNRVGIGEDILWTGSYWVSDHSHVVDASIYGFAGSDAEKYAAEQRIHFVPIHWSREGGKWYYYLDAATKATGWILDNGKWYYFGADKSMQTGWIKLNNYWYYLTDSGVMVADKFQQISEKLYRFDASGRMQTGWVKVNNSWYYFAAGGVMVADKFQRINGKLYRFDASGRMQTGWVKVNNQWYYFAAGGAMQTGWQKINGKWYFLKSSGVMAAGEWQFGYWLNADGSWTYQPRGSWKKNGSRWWYGDTSGWYAKNSTVRINDVNYTFDKNGYWIEK